MSDFEDDFEDQQQNIQHQQETQHHTQQQTQQYQAQRQTQRNTTGEHIYANSQETGINNIEGGADYTYDVPRRKQESNGGDNIRENWHFLSQAVLGQNKRRKETKHKMDLPRFSGAKGSDPRHYFLKMSAFLTGMDIGKGEERIRVFLQSLEGEALDLYLTLNLGQQSDLDFLKETFCTHFRPKKHAVLGVGEVLRLRKTSEETISEFYLRLRKKADEFHVGKEVLAAVFVQGLPVEYQKHIASQGVMNIEDMVQVNLAHERISSIDSSSHYKQVNVVENREMDDLRRKIDKLCDKVEEIQCNNYETRNNSNFYERNYQQPLYERRRFNQPSNFGMRNNSGMKGNSNGNNGRFDRNNDKSKIRCFFCGFKGHKVVECRKLKALKESQDPKRQEGNRIQGVANTQNNIGNGQKFQDTPPQTNNTKSNQTRRGNECRVVTSTETEEETETMKIKGVQRNKIGWSKEHDQITKNLTTSNVTTVIFGDSIIKNLSKYNGKYKDNWNNINIFNAGIGGDRIENVLYRIESTRLPSIIKEVIIAVGTNNLVDDSLTDIISKLIQCKEAVLDQLKGTKVFVMSILPREHINSGYKEKIRQINEILKENFGEGFLDTYHEFMSLKGVPIRSRFRSDGLHLSDTGMESLVKFLLKRFGDKGKKEMVNFARSVNYQEEMIGIPINVDKMTIKAWLDGEEVSILLDTGSSVSLMDLRVLDRFKTVRIERNNGHM